jgi:hypothetical protein
MGAYISYDENEVHDYGPCGRIQNILFPCNLWMSPINYSACPWQAFQPIVGYNFGLLGPYDENKLLWLWSLWQYSKHFFSLGLMNEPYKLKYLAMASCSSLVLGTGLSYLTHTLVTEKWSAINLVLVVVLKTLYFIVTYERAQLTKVPTPGKPFQPNVVQHLSLLGAYIS